MYSLNSRLYASAGSCVINMMAALVSQRWYEPLKTSSDRREPHVINSLLTLGSPATVQVDVTGATSVSDVLSNIDRNFLPTMSLLIFNLFLKINK